MNDLSTAKGFSQRPAADLSSISSTGFHHPPPPGCRTLVLSASPPFLQVALVDQLLDEVWAGPWAVALNPGWYGGDVPPQYKELVASWEAAYSLMITATKVGGKRAGGGGGGAQYD